MKRIESKMLALCLILACPWAAAAPAPTPGAIILALNCPDGNSDPQCPNNLAAGGKRASPSAREQEQQLEQQRAKQQASRSI